MKVVTKKMMTPKDGQGGIRHYTVRIFRIIKSSPQSKFDNVDYSSLTPFE